MKEQQMRRMGKQKPQFQWIQWKGWKNDRRRRNQIMSHGVAQRHHWIQGWVLLKTYIYPLLVWINVSNAKVVFL